MARNWTNSALQTDATTYALSSNSILLLWWLVSARSWPSVPTCCPGSPSCWSVSGVFQTHLEYRYQQAVHNQLHFNDSTLPYSLFLFHRKLNKETDSDIWVIVVRAGTGAGFQPRETKLASNNNNNNNKIFICLHTRTPVVQYGKSITTVMICEIGLNWHHNTVHYFHYK